MSASAPGLHDRTLKFSVPAVLVTVATAAVAIVLVFAFIPRSGLGPLGSDAPTASAAPTPSGTPTATADATASTTLTPRPTPAETPVARWTGLSWTAGVAPFAPNSSWISDVVAWGDGFIAAGGTFAADGPGQGTIFSSSDGQHWSVTFQAELPDGWSFAHLVRLGDGLLAISDQRGVSCAPGESPCPPEGFDTTPRLWSSSNGTDWRQIDSPSWRELLQDALPFDVVGGDAGVVAVIYAGAVLSSTDGHAWQRTELPADETAIPLDLTAFEGGFVIVGRDGARDHMSEVVESPLPPGIGRPAAWVSANGIDWTTADVEGSVVAGGELREVAAGADGLFAVGIGEPVEVQAHRPTHGWTSADGVTWRMVGRLGEGLPAFGGKLLAEGLLLGDGDRMLIFGPSSTESLSVVGWTSADGVSWERLTFAGAATDFEFGVWGEAGPKGIRYLTHAWLVDRGVIAVVYDGDIGFWFGTAIER